MVIDYVIPFVNGKDPEWQKEYNKFAAKKKDWSNNETRYRDWDTLRYQLRSIEKNMPWINRVFLVLSIGESQIPEWLNRKNPKIRIVYDWEIVPKNILPVFNSNVIDLCIPKIKGLAERYLYVCDDYLIMKPLKPEDFFTEDGKIRLKIGIFRYIDSVYARTLVNGTKLISPELLTEEKNKNGVIHHHVIPYANHTVTPHLKSVNLELMKKYQKEIEGSLTKFRSDKNLTWLIYPLNARKKGLRTDSEVTVECRMLRRVEHAQDITTKCDVEVLNDCLMDNTYDKARNALVKSMNNVFSEKSEFEI